MLYPHRGSIQQYVQNMDDPDRGRPSSCPQCLEKQPLRAHGFYSRTIVEDALGQVIRIRRYLCKVCLRTVSLLPEGVLPFMRFGIGTIATAIKARLMESHRWKIAAPAAPYQRGQHWVRRFAKQAESLSAALIALTPVNDACSFVARALRMLEKIGWIQAHRFLFSDLRMHLLGWGPSLAPHGRCVKFNGVSVHGRPVPQTTCSDSEKRPD